MGVFLNGFLNLGVSIRSKIFAIFLDGSFALAGHSNGVRYRAQSASTWKASVLTTIKKSKDLPQGFLLLSLEYKQMAQCSSFMEPHASKSIMK